MKAKFGFDLKIIAVPVFKYIINNIYSSHFSDSEGHVFREASGFRQTGRFTLLV